jgi:hypothetical protein
MKFDNRKVKFRETLRNARRQKGKECDREEKEWRKQMNQGKAE